MSKISYLEDCDTEREEIERHQKARDETVHVSNIQEKQFREKTKYHAVEKCASNGQGSARPLSRYEAELNGYFPCSVCVND